MVIESPAKILATHLVSLGIGTWNGAWPITYSNLPDNLPVQRIALFDTGKILLGSYQKLTGVVIGTPQKPLVQVRIRTEAAKYDVGWAKGEQMAGQGGIFDQIKGVIVTVAPNQFLLESARVYMGLVPIGQTGDRRDWHFTVNVRLTLKTV